MDPSINDADFNDPAFTALVKDASASNRVLPPPPGGLEQLARDMMVNAFASQEEYVAHLEKKLDRLAEKNTRISKKKATGSMVKSTDLYDRAVVESTGINSTYAAAAAAAATAAAVAEEESLHKSILAPTGASDDTAGTEDADADVNAESPEGNDG